MVNDKMVNGFMEKKLYNSPLTEVMNLSTELMQHVSTTSEGNDNFPGGPAGAPKRTEPKAF